MSGDMLVVGLTGRSGSGKSSVAAHLSTLGYPVSDGDAISRQVCLPGTPCLRQLVQAFGGDILLPDGALNRRELGRIAFADEEKTRRLVSITHPHIIEEFLRQAATARSTGAKLFFADGAVIVGGPFEPYCDRIVVVVTEERLAVSRIILRDGISKQAAYARLAAQMPAEQLLQAADYTIENNGSLQRLHTNTEEVVAKLLCGHKAGEVER